LFAPFRYCERGEAIHLFRDTEENKMDCFAALAMTTLGAEVFAELFSKSDRLLS